MDDNRLVVKYRSLRLEGQVEYTFSRLLGSLNQVLYSL